MIRPVHNGQSRSGFTDLVCFSHLRWDFVYQRPQHLMSRFAMQRRVFYVEEPVWTSGTQRLEHSVRKCGVVVVVPHLREGQTDEEVSFKLQNLLKNFFKGQKIESFCIWYYNPMALPWTMEMQPLARVYDCMDELSAFRNAHKELKRRERELFRHSDIVFTGGHSLFEAKKKQHHNVYAFPSSIDVRHFAACRTRLPSPADQDSIPRPRIGFCGVIDERMDYQLLSGMAELRPDWQFIMVGPVVKVDPAELPSQKNIHYLGMKDYQEIPKYIGGWDVAILPFAKNESTRYISPTKTPEYLAAGKPVVSTSIPDVIEPYGVCGLVKIADHPQEFVEAIEEAMQEDRDRRLRRVDELLSQNSWCQTWGRMSELLEDIIQERQYQRPRMFAAAACSP